MNSEIAICNKALYNIGVSRRIASLSEASQEAKVCNAFYESARDELLTEHPWHFARARTSLPESVEEIFDGFDDEDSLSLHAYRYPTGCLNIVRVFSPEFLRTSAKYKIRRSASGGKLIITPMENAYCEYTMQVTDPLEFPAPFAEALAWKLATKIALSLKGDSTGLRDNLMQYFGDAFSRAVMLDANEQSNFERPSECCEYLRCRA